VGMLVGSDNIAAVSILLALFDAISCAGFNCFHVLRLLKLQLCHGSCEHGAVDGLAVWCAWQFPGEGSGAPPVS